MTFKVKDHYFNKAKQEAYLARSVYKLQEIDEKYLLTKNVKSAVDLGSYPGSWTQYLDKKLPEDAPIYSIDLTEPHPILETMERVHVRQMDVFELSKPEDLGASHKFDLVVSDMAPKTMGVKMVDQARSLELVEKVFNLLPIVLASGGHCVAKVFESQDARDFLQTQRKFFEKLTSFKPKSTRSISKEFFIIGMGFKNYD